MEDMRRFCDERMSAIENSLSFALTTAETMTKRLSEVEQRAQQVESDFHLCVKRMAEMEQELVGMQQELRDWLVFSGRVILRLSRSTKNEDASAACSSTTRVSVWTCIKCWSSTEKEDKST